MRKFPKRCKIFESNTEGERSENGCCSTTLVSLLWWQRRQCQLNGRRLKLLEAAAHALSENNPDYMPLRAQIAFNTRDLNACFCTYSGGAVIASRGFHKKWLRFSDFISYSLISINRMHEVRKRSRNIHSSAAQLIISCNWSQTRIAFWMENIRVRRTRISVFNLILSFNKNTFVAAVVRWFHICWQKYHFKYFMWH